jgi:RNA polymerase sigma-70 factor, ECF subfamily
MYAADEFDEFYRGTVRRLTQYAYSMMGDLPDAQDAAHEAYVRAWRRWPRLRGYEQAEGWLRLVVTRLATDRWRRLQSHRMALARLGGEPSPVAPSEDSVLLVTALKRLPPVHRRALALHYLCDLSINDIAAETGATSGTVKSWLSRGRERLAEALAELAPLRGKEPNDVH